MCLKMVPDVLMKITRISARVVVFAALLIVALGLHTASANADQVDDLLAGKPVKIETESGETAPPVVAERVVVPVEEKTLADESWEVVQVDPAKASLENAEADQKLSRPVRPAAAISVVPEPSAIALAALSLVYFLLFFRRRYSY
jgi:hypothetical protein